MLERPNNYEEAKIIIKNSVDDEYEHRNMKVNALRAGIITAISFGIAGLIGLATKKPIAFLSMLPPAIIMSLSGLGPILAQWRTNNRINSGQYFQNKSEEQIINIADDYVEEYNNFMKKR